MVLTYDQRHYGKHHLKNTKMNVHLLNLIYYFDIDHIQHLRPVNNLRFQCKC